MVVTVDAQLFYPVLAGAAVPRQLPLRVHRADAQPLRLDRHRLVVFERLPGGREDGEGVRRSARRALETWDAADPNRKMALEETPVARRGAGRQGRRRGARQRPRPARREGGARRGARQAPEGADLDRRLPLVAGRPAVAVHDALHHARLRQGARSSGSRCRRTWSSRAGSYLAKHYRDDLRGMMTKDCCWEFLTFLNYVATVYPDASWTGRRFDARGAQGDPRLLVQALEAALAVPQGLPRPHAEAHGPAEGRAARLRRASWTRRRRPRSRARSGRPRTAPGSGTTTRSRPTPSRCARSWSSTPKDPRRDGLVQWLLLNKKLNQWKSTRATAEVIYSLVHYLKAEGALGIARGR